MATIGSFLAMLARIDGVAASMIRSDRAFVPQRFAEVPDFGVVAAADQLEQDAVRPGVGDFERVEVVQRREFLVAANRQPIVEHARMLAALRRVDRLEALSSASADVCSAASIPEPGAPIPVSARLSQRWFCARES